MVLVIELLFFMMKRAAFVMPLLVEALSVWLNQPLKAC